MIQEPLTNLEQILQEPVFKISGQVPALKRLTVKLVAFEPSSLTAPAGEAKGLLPVAESNPFTPLPETNDEGEDWFYSYDETPTASFYTPEPERGRISDPALPIFSPDLAYFGDGIEYALRSGDVEREWDEFGIEDEIDANVIVSSSLSNQRAIVLPSSTSLLSGQRAVVSLSSAQPRVRHFDATLFYLTALLLLGILGGIGFGYLLTLVNQG